MRRLLLSICCLLLGGCYSYQPIQLEEARPGEDVRVRLSAAESQRLFDESGFDVRLVTGDFVERDGDRILVSTPSAIASTGSASRRLQQRVGISTVGIVEIERKRFDKFRTGIVIGAGAVAVSAVVIAAFNDDGSPSNNPKPNPDAIRIPVWSLPIGR